MKKVLLITTFVFLLSINSLLAQTAVAPIYGDGSADLPYVIVSLENLNWIAAEESRWSYHYAQMADMDASGTACGYIGNGEARFTGRYNGQGYTIENMIRPLFALLDNGAVISNLGIINCNIEDPYYSGGLVSTAFGGTITNCFVTGNLQGETFIGGLAGFFEGIVSNCYCDVNISANNSYVGGLIGLAVAGSISNCYSRGTISEAEGSGGLVGSNGATIINCYSTAEVAGNSQYQGGLIGVGDTSYVTNSFWDIETSLHTNSPGGGTGKTTAEMTTDALNVNYVNNIYLAGIWDFKGETTNGSDEVWNIGNGRNDGYPYHDWQYSDDFPSLTMAPLGEGTSGNPFQIATWQNLLWTSQNSNEWDKCYIQTANIDLTVAIPTVTNWDSGAGWTPIGNETIKFTGSYDGQDYTINGIFIDRTAGYQGMFGYTNGSSIQNLGLTDVDIINSGGNYTGGLVAFNYNSSEVNNCYSTGSVTDLVGWDTGGLVGANYASSTVTNSYSTCTVSGDGNTGGLVGWNYGGSTVSNSYSTGDVISEGTPHPIHTGGLIGLIQSATVNNSYATGNVSGVENTGCFAGTMSSSTVSNCYSLGDVTRSSGTNTFFGGFTGNVSSSIIEYCYSSGSVFQSDGVAWADGTKGFIGGEDGSNTYTSNFFDAEESNQSTASGAAGKTTAEMKNATTIDNIYLDAGWDFKGETTNGTDNIWNIGNGRNDSYPYFDWQYPGDDTTLPVELSSFTAQFISSLPILCWTTQSESGNAGWNVYRGDYRDAFINGDAIQINPELIEGAGTTSIPTNYTFEDQYDVIQGTEYWYILESIDYSGETYLYGSVSLIIPEEGTTPELPQITVLKENYPNPFNPSTIIYFSVKENETAQLSIFNAKGQNLESISFEAGIYNYLWDASSYATGTYLYKLESESFSVTKKMILLK